MAKRSRILTVGGGSGGHILPVAAVIDELLKIDPGLEIRFWCDKNTRTLADEIILKYPVKIEQIVAGKLRRYYHLKWWQHFQWSIMGPNLVDGFKVLVGFSQSLVKLIIWRPKVVFAKGGFVCLPVGLASGLLGIKIVVHDSDTMAGLTNRILGKFAVKIATGYPTQYYNYSSKKVIYTGIPIKPTYRPISITRQAQLKTKLGFEPDRPLVTLTGGGMGSKLLNDTLIQLVGQHKLKTNFALLAGDRDYQRAVATYRPKQDQFARLVINNFVNNLDEFILASDVVISRAGASTIAELAAAEKPVIIIPNPKLTGGHQVKNAQILEQARAALVINESSLRSDPDELNRVVEKVLSELHHSWVSDMSTNFSKFAKIDAAKRLAVVIIDAIKNRDNRD